jgi:probable F420-dependent oxidoreductase
MATLGVTLPFDDVTLTDHRPLLRTLVEAGYHEFWTGEVAGPDGFTPLALFRGWEESITISCAVASVFTRGPAVLAITAASMAEAAPGSCRFGIGAGSPAVATTWNGAKFERPYQKVVDSLRFLRQVLAGEKADDYETVHGQGFKLARPVEVQPKLMLGVAGPKMQDFAAAEADTMALNFLSADDVAMIRRRCANVNRVAPGELETAARIFVIPGDGEAGEAAARRFLAGYLTVPTYAQFQDWLGRGEDLRELNDAWQAGDRKKAMAVIPDHVVRDLVVFGTPDECAASIDRYFEAGLDAATLLLLPSPTPLAPEARVEFLADVIAKVQGLS